MPRLRRNVPTALALVALVVAVGGEAIADQVASVAQKLDGGDIAKNAIKSKHVAKNALKSRDVAGLKVKDFKKSQRSKLEGPKGEKGDRGEQGPIGPQGPAGANGANGATGATGATGANGADGVDGFGGGMNQTVVVANTTRFSALMGGGQEITEANGIGLSPNQTLVLKDFAVEVTTAVNAAETVTLTVRVEGADTGVACTVTGPATTCSSGAQVTIDPRSRVAVRIVNTTTLNPAIAWSWTFERA